MTDNSEAAPVLDPSKESIKNANLVGRELHSALSVWSIYFQIRYLHGSRLSLFFSLGRIVSAPHQCPPVSTHFGFPQIRITHPFFPFAGPGSGKWDEDS